MKISFLLMGALMLLVAACKKQGADKKTAAMTFSKDALSYVQLPLKRYFIYKDSASGSLDSVIVTTSDLYTYVHPGHISTGLFDFAYDAYNVQAYKLQLTRFSGQATWFYGAADANFFNSLPFNDTAAVLSFCGTDNILPVAIAAATNCYYGFTYDSYGANGALPAMTVEGKTYNGVFRFQGSNPGEPDSTRPLYYASTYYWAKNTGIIKRTVRAGGITSASTLLRFGN